MLYSSCRKRGSKLINWVKLSGFGFLWKNKLKVILQIHNCFWDEFWQGPLHNSVWYQIASEQKSFHNPQNASADQQKKFNTCSNTEEAPANRNKTLWHSSENRSIQDKCLFLLSESTTTVILHSGAAFSRQGECPIYCCKRKLAHGTRMPAVRMMPCKTGASFPDLELATTPGIDTTHSGSD